MDVSSTNPKYADMPPKTKFPGGTNDLHPEDNRDPERTLRREIEEETDLTIMPEAKVKLVARFAVSPTHYKTFWLIEFEDCKGNLRTEFKIQEDDKMSPPYWVTLEEAGRILFVGHQQGLLGAMRELRP